MFPDWEFGIKEERIAARVRGIDFIQTGHMHDSLPRLVQVGRAPLIATGASGRFISRLDLDV